MARPGQDPRLFSHYDFLAAHQEATLQRLSELVPEGSSLRKGMQALVKLKTPEEAERIRTAALRYLVAHGEDVVPEDREAAQERLVAVFPLQT